MYFSRCTYSIYFSRHNSQLLPVTHWYFPNTQVRDILLPVSVCQNNLFGKYIMWKILSGQEELFIKKKYERYFFKGLTEKKKRKVESGKKEKWKLYLLRKNKNFFEKAEKIVNTLMNFINHSLVFFSRSKMSKERSGSRRVHFWN